MSDVTRILAQIESGDSVAMNELLPIVYDELRRMAAAQMLREKPGQTLQATALVHEAYVKLIGGNYDCSFANRRHFFGAAADAMRHILIDKARRKNRQKHGGQLKRVELDEEFLIQPQEEDEQLLALNEALTRFTEHAPDKAELVKLKVFAGRTLDDAAAMLGISPSTADRWWKYARAWLKVEAENYAEELF